MSDAISTPTSAPSATPSATPSASSASPAAPASSSTPPPTSSSTASATPSEKSSAASPAQTEAQKAEIKRQLYKIKVDGKEKEIDWDSLSDEERAYKLQFAEAAQQRIKESTEVKKLFQKFLEDFKKDPFSTVKDPMFEMDLEKLAEERLLKKYEEELLPEAEREKLRMQRELEEYKNKEASLRKQQEEFAKKQYEEQVYKDTVSQFAEAIQKAGLKPHPRLLAVMADIADVNLEYGVELTPQQIAAKARERIEGDIDTYLGDLDGEQLFQRLGEERVKKITQFYVSKVRGEMQTTPQPPAQKPPAPSAEQPIEKEPLFAKERPPAPKYKNASEYFRSLRFDK